MSMYRITEDEKELELILNTNEMSFSSCLTFYGSVADITKVNPADYSDGTVLLNNYDNLTYLKVDNTWESLGPITTPSPSYDKCMTEASIEPRMELVEDKCDSCGAPIRVKSKYDTSVTCEYCGTTYRFEPKRD